MNQQSVTRRRRLLGIGIVIAVALLAAACSDSDDGATESTGDATEATVGDTTDSEEASDEPTVESEKPELVIAIPGEPPSMDLMRSPSTLLWAVVAPNVAEALATSNFGADGVTVEPLLATSWEQTDELTWRVELRDGVTFSNGDPMTAEDVAASINYGIDETSGYYDTFYSTVAEAMPAGDLAIDIVLNAPDPILPRRLPFLKVMPQSILSPEALATTFEGVGPYVLTAWDRGQQIVLEPSENYWGDEPRYSRIVFLIRPEEGSRVAAVQAGEADIAREINAESAGLVPQVLNAGAYEVAGFMLNTTGQKEGGSIMENKLVRLAVNHAVDRAAIRDSLFAGQADVSHCQYNPITFAGTDPALEDYEYDPELARQLIQEAGVEGATVQIYAMNLFPKADELSAVLGQYLEEIGLVAELTTVELDQWLEFYAAGAAGGNVPYDLTTLYHGNDLFESTVKTFDSLKSSELGGGRWLIDDDRLDTAVLAAQQSPLDARVARMQEVWHIFCDEAYALPLVSPEFLYGAGDNVEWTPPPNGEMVIDDILLVDGS